MQTLIHQPRSGPARTFSPMASSGSRPFAQGRDRRADARACRLAIAIAGALCDVEIEDIAAPNRSSAHVCEARHIAMYLAHVVFQVSLIRSGAAFGRDRTSVSHAVRRIEDGRDDPSFDARIERLETLARSVGHALAVDETGEGRARS